MNEDLFASLLPFLASQGVTDASLFGTEVLAACTPTYPDSGLNDTVLQTATTEMLNGQYSALSARLAAIVGQRNVLAVQGATFSALQPFLPPAVVNWRYTIENDWSGDPSLFFWITLSDEAAKPQNLAQITKYITSIITQQINPRGQWGLIPYINFRSHSEQAALKEEVFGVSDGLP
jgi:hypothetical protein